MLGRVGRFDLDHRVRVIAKRQSAVRLVGDVARLARVSAGELAGGKDDDPGAGARADQHAAAQLALAQETQERLHINPRGVQLGVHRSRYGQLVEAVDQLR